MNDDISLLPPSLFRLAFQRALDLDPVCVGALVGLAILELNIKQVCYC